MSRIIANQLRLLEESSRLQASHMGLSGGMEGKNPMAPMAEEQKHPNLKKDASLRGKGKGHRGSVLDGHDLRGSSSYVEPFSQVSVGFDLLLEDTKGQVNKKPMLKRKGKRKIDYPDRMGKSDKSGMALPHNKDPKPPTKSSSLVHKHISKKVDKKLNKKVNRNNREVMEEETK